MRIKHVDPVELTILKCARLAPVFFLSIAFLVFSFSPTVAWAIPPAPTNLTATAASSKQINLSWIDNASTESNYYVQRSPDGLSSSWTAIATLGANVTSYQDTGLTQNTTYYYRVYCRSITGTSFFSNTAGTMTVPLAAPSALAATVASTLQINLSWTDNTAYETNYYVERSPNGSDSWTVIATLGANVTTYPDYGLFVGTAYYYRVRAYDGTNYSTYSSIVNQIIRNIIAIAGPNGTISPNGGAVANGSTQVFTISPNSCYKIATESVDGGAVATNPTYTFSNITANHAISANFALNTFTITSTTGTNGTISPYGAVAVNACTSQTFTVTSNSGYHISDVLVDGVSVGAVSTYTVTNVTVNHTIAVSFAINTFNVTPSVTGGSGTINPSTQQIVSYGSNTAFSITPNTGNYLSNLSVDGSSVATASTYTFTNVTANHTIAATFSAITYTITASSGANGTISPVGAVSIVSGATKTFAITPNTGNYLSNLSVDGSSVATASTYTFTNVTANHTINATFSAITYTITASSGANGTISPVGAVSVVSGATKTFAMTPNAGNYLSNLSVDGSSVATLSTYTFTNIAANHTIAATFSANTYNITASVGANGTISPSGIVSVNSGATTTCTITPNIAYHVSDVLVDGASVGAVSTYTFTNVTANHTIAANFAINTYTITASADADGTISLSGIVSVNSGATTTFTMTPDTGYHVLDVLVDGVSQGAITSYLFTNVIANHTISASFEADASVALILSGVAITSNTLNTALAETATIFYTLNSHATVTLKIIPEKLGPAGTPVYQVAQACPAVGAYLFTWSGNDSTGKVVPDEAYLYLLEASNGTSTTSYNPAAPTGTGTVSCSQAASYDPYKNEPLIISYSTSAAERVYISISWGTSFKNVSVVPRGPGSYTYDWDGRDSSGNILGGSINAAQCSATSLLSENYIITIGDTPVVTMVKTNPYAIHLSYGQLTRIKYTLSRDANVTVSVTSPSGATSVLTNNEYQVSGAHEFEWKVMDVSDSTGKRFITSDEGDYTVLVQAVNPSTGTSSTSKANVSIGY